MEQRDLDCLLAIFASALELSSGTPDVEIRRLAIERWDSFAHVNIVTAIESEFDLSLDARDIERISSFEAARLLVEEKRQ